MGIINVLRGDYCVSTKIIKYGDHHGCDSEIG